MDLWIPITIAAAFFQNLRSALQKQLTESLSTWGVTSARFIFAAPLAVVFAAALLNSGSVETPGPTRPFMLYGLIGGTAQILGTGLFIQLFSYRNFAIGTAFTKTEAIQTALFGLVVLGDTLTSASLIAIVISVVGVVLISTPKQGSETQYIFNRATLTGLASGAFFGISAVAYRGASLSLEGGNYLARAALTLACVTVFQSLLIAAWLRFSEPGELSRVVTSWRKTSLVGLAGMLASLGWFTAMTLENAAYVRAVGQIEILFTLAASYFFSKKFWPCGNFPAYCWWSQEF